MCCKELDGAGEKQKLPECHQHGAGSEELFSILGSLLPPFSLSSWPLSWVVFWAPACFELSPYSLLLLISPCKPDPPPPQKNDTSAFSCPSESFRGLNGVGGMKLGPLVFNPGLVLPYLVVPVPHSSHLRSRNGDYHSASEQGFWKGLNDLMHRELTSVPSMQ